MAKVEINGLLIPEQVFASISTMAAGNGMKTGAFLVMLIERGLAETKAIEAAATVAICEGNAPGGAQECPSTDELLEALYKSEINFELGCFWDGGFNWQLGASYDPAAIKAKGTCKKYVDAVVQLVQAAMEHYPDSQFAKWLDTKVPVVKV